LDIEGDSELVINQMKGVYKVRKPRLYKLYQRAKNLVNRRNRIYAYEFIHISRDRNARADVLAREAIEMQSDWDEDYY
jgi:ribonuclease HI